MKKLVVSLMLIALMGTVNAAILDEDFSSYTDFSWLGEGVLTPGPTGWFYPSGSGGSANEGVKSLVTDLSTEPVGTAPGGTNTALKITFGDSSAQKDTNIGWVSASDVFLANTVYTFSFDFAVGVGQTDDIASIFICGNGTEEELNRNVLLDITPDNGWVHVDIVVDTAQTYNFDPLGKLFRIQFNMDGGQTKSTSPTDDIYLTNVQITPEPATIMLLGLGGLLLRRKRS